MKVLVVDDSPTARKIVRTFLKSMDIDDIFEADDGLNALEILKSDDIDIIITDWNMPRLNGIELVSVIRNNNKLQHIPVILITTRGEKEDVLNAFNFKINAYITKPFTAIVFEEKFNKVINEFKILKKNEALNSNINITHNINGSNLSNIKTIDFDYIRTDSTNNEFKQSKTFKSKTNALHDYTLITQQIVKNDKMKFSVMLYDGNNQLIDKITFD